jgi:hypothetical protein
VEFSGDDWSLLMYTDGLIEGHTGVGNERLDVDGLCALLGEPAAAECRWPRCRPGWWAGPSRQRRPARRRRGDAADLPGRWPVSLFGLRPGPCGAGGRACA